MIALGSKLKNNWRVHTRIYTIAGLFLLLYGAVLYRLYDLQIVNSARLKARAASQYDDIRLLAPTRGTISITDKNGSDIPIAVNVAYPVIFAVPSELDDVAEAVERIGDILGQDKDILKKKFAQQKNLYVVLSHRADEASIKKFEEAAIKGVYVNEEEGRFYPLHTLAAHVVGFVGFDEEDRMSGRYGIEFMDDLRLRGFSGKRNDAGLVRATHGEDIKLTIDRNIEEKAEEILGKLVSTHNAEGGTIIVQEPKTGKIIAFANNPVFDPNEYGKYGIEIFLNTGVQAIYEPGSIMKLVTMAAGIDAGAITPETTFYDTGELPFAGHIIRNWDLLSHGLVTMTEVIAESINTGAAFVGKALGNVRFLEYLKKFGLNEKTGVDLPGEVSGTLKNLEKNKNPVDFATASFGQGIAVTPISLITAISVIANGGNLMRPYIERGTTPKVRRRVIDEETATKVTRMMIAAVKHGKIADIPGYDVAAKTGTAQFPDFKNGGYTEDVINSYAGYIPAFDPRFTILVKLNKPAGAPLAGGTVVPAFRELAEFILDYYNIPPNKKIETRNPKS